MATQFEVLIGKLDEILGRLDTIEAQIRAWIQSETMDFNQEAEEFWDEVNDPSEGDDPITPKPKNMNRREVEVRGFDGEPVMFKWSEIDPRIVKAVELSTKNGKDYELYEDQSGTVRISVEAEIAHMMRKAETYQQPVPKVGDRELDALGTEE